MPIYATQGAATGGARQTSLAARRRFWAVAVGRRSILAMVVCIVGEEGVYALPCDPRRLRVGQRNLFR
jgi:hypothetical protein